MNVRHQKYFDQNDWSRFKYLISLVDHIVSILPGSLYFLICYKVSLVSPEEAWVRVYRSLINLDHFY